MELFDVFETDSHLYMVMKLGSGLGLGLALTLTPYPNPYPNLTLIRTSTLTPTLSPNPHQVMEYCPAAWSKLPPRQCPRPAPAPPEGALDSSGWLGATRGEAGPRGAQPRPRVLELAASKAAYLSAFDHSGPGSLSSLLEMHGRLGETETRRLVKQPTPNSYPNTNTNPNADPHPHAPPGEAANP